MAYNYHDLRDALGWLDGLHDHRRGYRYGGFPSFRAPGLVPTLRPGDVVVMDNLPPHKSAETLCLIQQLGAEVLFLPAYSPDFNPIEKMWSKLKEFLRSAEARSQPSLIQAIASALETITAQDGINWFASCGYSFI